MHQVQPYMLLFELDLVIGGVVCGIVCWVAQLVSGLEGLNRTAATGGVGVIAGCCRSVPA